MPENDTSDVLPAWANQILILLWLLLFGGRWLLPPALQMAGLLSPRQLAALDETVLLKLYLLLLAATCVVVALRAVRVAQSGGQTLLPANASAPIGNADAADLPAASPDGAEPDGDAREDTADNEPLQADAQMSAASPEETRIRD